MSHKFNSNKIWLSFSFNKPNLRQKKKNKPNQVTSSVTSPINGMITHKFITILFLFSMIRSNGSRLVVVQLKRIKMVVVLISCPSSMSWGLNRYISSHVKPANFVLCHHGQFFLKGSSSHVPLYRDVRCISPISLN